MTFSWMSTYGQYFVVGIINTFLLLGISWNFGFGLAILVALGRISKNKPISWLCRAYISIIRGTPLLVQIFLIYYGLASFFASTPFIRQSFAWPYIRNLDAFWYVALALSLSIGAYVGEVVRGALLNVPRGEIEAARAFGFYGVRLFQRIWLPRALQSIVPTIAGEMILLLKSTALASTVTVMDLLGAARLVSAQTFRTYEPLLLAAVGYFLITLTIEAIFRRVEKRVQRSYALNS